VTEPFFETRVDWEYGGKVEDGSGYRGRSGYRPGGTSITIEKGEGWDGSGLAAYRAHAILRPTGRATHLHVSSLGSDTDYAEKHADKPRRAWSMFRNQVEGFYDPVTYDG